MLIRLAPFESGVQPASFHTEALLSAEFFLSRRCLVGDVDIVPHAKGVPALRHHHVAIWNPLDVRAVAQQDSPALRLDVVPVGQHYPWTAFVVHSASSQQLSLKNSGMDPIRNKSGEYQTLEPCSGRHHSLLELA